MALFGIDAQNIMEYEAGCAVLYPGALSAGWFILTQMGIEIESPFHSVWIVVGVILVIKLLDLYLSFRADRPLDLEALSIAVVVNLILAAVAFGLAAGFGRITIDPDGWNWERCVSYMSLTGTLCITRAIMFVVAMIVMVNYYALESLFGLTVQQRPPPRERGGH